MSNAHWIAALVCCALLGCGARPTERAVRTTAPSQVFEAVERPPDPGGIGSISARTARGDARQIELSKVRVRASQAGDVAEVAVEHTFVNDADEQLEGTFRFPMPADAIMTGLSMLIDGKWVDGALVEREKAERVFQEVVDSMQDPALLEWEHGTTFKMRVFPIEPKKPKLVTIRYLVPLHRKGDAYVFTQGTRLEGNGGKVGHFSIEWQGQERFAKRDFEASEPIDIVARPPERAYFEERNGERYTALRVQLDWAKIPVKPRPAPKNVLVAVDTSRSALEERKLMLESLRRLLEGLGEEKRFLVATSDIDVRVQETSFVSPSPESIRRALDFVEARGADGASDLAGLLKHAAGLLKESKEAAIVYIGDCEPTWGEQRESKLIERARTELGAVPFNAILIGSGTNPELARRLADETQGRVLAARSPEDVSAFAHELDRPQKRLSDIQLTLGSDAVVLPARRSSLGQGESFTVFTKAPHGAKPGIRLGIRAQADGQNLDLSQEFKVAPAPLVARRFGSEWVKELERQNTPKEQIVEASRSYGVMSKHTSFLVLESEAMYARYAIDHQNPAAHDAAPRVTGADLESASAGAGINLDRVQPGDPEIFIDAEEDAERVRVRFPWGQTKDAVFDPEANHGHGAWVVRFLVERGTKDGEYEAIAEILHRGGLAETRRVTYTVDGTPPELEVALHPNPVIPGRIEVRVTQRAAAGEVDLRRVEIRTPSGEISELSAVRWGEFRGSFTSSGSGILRLVGFDQAQNHSVREVRMP